MGPPEGSSRGRWTSRVGAWIGIGASPAALVLGGGLASRHDGPVPVWSILLGAALLVPLLTGVGILGVARPTGENAPLGLLLERYVDQWSRRALMLLIALAMVGWFGFHVGLGGAALSALLDAPPYIGPLAMGVAITWLTYGGVRRWNSVAVIAMVSTIILSGIVAVRLGLPTSPVDLDRPDPAILLTDVAGFVGYVAVFSVRSPDFTAGLAARRDLGWCVAFLVVPLVLLTLIGISVGRGTGSTDLVAILAGPDGSVGTALIAVAVTGAAFTTTHSGSLALASISPLRRRTAVALVAVAGISLAVARFDLLLLRWLGVLAAAIPPLVVPLGVEGLRRRKQKPRETVPVWTWLPASFVAVSLTLAGFDGAPLSGLALAALLTVAWRSFRRRTGT